MQTRAVTTPFGRRSINLALVRRQQAVTGIKEGKSADKWKVFHDASAAYEKLGIQSNSLAVLDALLTFHPGNELRQDGQLIVFPSNAQLSMRAHAMAGATLRRHLAILVEAGLIVRRDSANGKRYARRDGSGEIERAFGFDLSPLLARTEELAILAQQVASERAAFRRAKENLTICRRDVRKLITAAIAEGVDGDWQAAEDVYVGLTGSIPRTPNISDLTKILRGMELLHEEVLNRLENHELLQNSSTNDAHIERHIQNSNPESTYEVEQPSEQKSGVMPSKNNRPPKDSLKVFPLGLVLKACPQISDYSPDGTISGWRDLMSAAVVVRSMLGVTPSAYQSACEIMGPENAAAAIACILERATFINSAGAYLRDLTKRVERSEFSLGPMIMALLRENGEAALKRA